MRKWALLLLVVVGVAAFPQDERQYLPPKENTETKESKTPLNSAASPKNEVEELERFPESYNEFSDPVRAKDKYQVEGESDKQVNNFAQTHEYRHRYNVAFSDEQFSNERYNSGGGDVPSYSYNDRNTNSEAGEQYDLNINRFQESPSYFGTESEEKRPSSEYGGYDASNEVNKPYGNDNRNTVLAEEPNKRLSQDPFISSQQYPDREKASFDNRYFDKNPEIISNTRDGNERPHSVPQNSYYSEDYQQGYQDYKNDQRQFQGYNAADLQDEIGYEKERPDSQNKGYTSPDTPINQSELSETFPNQGNIQNNPNSRTPAHQTPSSLYGSPSSQGQQNPVVSNRDRQQTSDTSEVELLKQNQYNYPNSPREKIQSSGDRFQSTNTQSVGNDRRNNQEVQYDSRNRDYASDDSSYPSRDSSQQTDRLGNSNDDRQRISDSRYTDETSEYRPSELSTSNSSDEESPQGQQETTNSQNGPSSVPEFVPSNNPSLNEEASKFNGYNPQSDTSGGSQTSENGQRQPFQNEITALNANVEGLRPQEQDSPVNRNLNEGKPNIQVDEVTNFQNTAEALNGDNIEYNNNRENTISPLAGTLTPQIGRPNAVNDAAISQPLDPLYKPAQYEFDYRVLFPPTGTDFGHHERRVDAETQGEYFVLLPDGRTQVVEYEADEDGFKPNIRYEGVISKFRLGLNRLRF